MRVGMICPYSLTIPGGVQGQALGLARELRLLGHDVRVLGPCDGPPPDTGVTPLGESLPVGTNGSIAPIAPDVSAQLRTIRSLRDEGFDVLHLHEPFCPGPTQTSLFFKTAPIVATFHAAGADANYRRFGPAIRRAARRIDVRCAVSEDAQQLAAHAFTGGIEVLFNGVEVPLYRTGPTVPTDGPTVLFVGRHEERKGLSVLLDAMGELDSRTRLWIASDGPETAALQRKVAGDPRIEWLGRISEQEKAIRMRSADVFCAPSLHGESFGVVLLEAMAARVAVVASSLPGYANVARGGQDAVLVPPGDPRALAAAIREAFEPATRDRLIASGIERADEFSMARLASIYADRYERAVHGVVRVR